MRKRWDKTERNTRGETSARTTYPTWHTALLSPSTTARDGGKIGRIPARRAVWAGNLQPTPTGLSLPRADIKPHNGWKGIFPLNLRTQRFGESANNPPLCTIQHAAIPLCNCNPPQKPPHRAGSRLQQLPYMGTHEEKFPRLPRVKRTLINHQHFPKTVVCSVQ